MGLRDEIAEIVDLRTSGDYLKSHGENAADRVLALLRECSLCEVVQTLGYSWMTFDVGDHPGGSATVELKWLAPPEQRNVLVVDLGS
jgi:hypothetical protein